VKAQLLQPFHPYIFEFLLSLQMKRKANIAQGLDAGFGQSAVDMKSALRHDPPSQVATPPNRHIYMARFFFKFQEPLVLAPPQDISLVASLFRHAPRLRLLCLII
jgi:hypothetical protein